MLIPNSDPQGGDTDGMGDLDNTPMPPMDADTMDDGMGGDPMGGGVEPTMDDPNAMGDDALMGEDPMGGDAADGMEDPTMGGGENDEFMDKFNSLSKEKQVAVEKYADSMIDDKPMESYRSIKNVIDETINDILNGKKEGTKRPSKKLPKEYRLMQNPFKSPF